MYPAIFGEIRAAADEKSDTLLVCLAFKKGRLGYEQCNAKTRNSAHRGLHHQS